MLERIQKENDIKTLETEELELLATLDENDQL